MTDKNLHSATCKWPWCMWWLFASAIVGCAWSTTVPPKIASVRCQSHAEILRCPNRICPLKDIQSHSFRPSVVLKLWLLSVQSVSHCILHWPWHTCWYKWSQQRWARYSNQEWITHSELHSDKCTNSNHRWSVWKISSAPWPCTSSYTTSVWVNEERVSLLSAVSKINHFPHQTLQ